jgi:protein-tyrosine phosphatase
VIPLVDMHCHLLAGLDDGPRSQEHALEMCRIAHAEGVRLICATAHQNRRYSRVTPESIRTSARALAESLRASGLGLTAFPCAEVMVHPDIEASWAASQLMSVADHGKYLLMELPTGLYVDLRPTVLRLVELGVRPILAHPERQPEFLHGSNEIERLIRAGCLVQVSTRSITDPLRGEDLRALRDWYKRGLVHLMGSDGHSPNQRPPLMAKAYRKIVRWIGATAADRVCSTNGMAILQGLPLRVPAPLVRRKRGFSLW